MEGSDIPIVLIDSGQLYPYSFSHALNVKNRLDIKHIMLLETLFSSEHPSTSKYSYVDGKACPLFGESENNSTEAFKLLKEGMYSFSDDFHQVETDLGFTLQISGYDAFLPINEINSNYKYMMYLYGDLNSNDMVASSSVNIKKLLKKYNYTK